MIDNFYYLKQPIPLDSVDGIEYFTKGFQVNWRDIGPEGHCPVKIAYEENILVIHWKNDSQFREIITHFEI